MFLTESKLISVLERGLDINVFISDRGGRKSSVIQSAFIREALAGRPFILLRSKRDENITDGWLSQHTREIYPDYTFYSEKITPNISAIYFNTPTDEKVLLCYGMYLSLRKKYKSSYYPGFEKVKYIVWEECVESEPILQNIRHIKHWCMQEINAVLDIASTVSRNNRVQHIWLGNDIKENILNPVTVSFNLLELLTEDVEIISEDGAIINDRRYSFYFNYFSFPGAVNHWLYSDNLHISDRIMPPENIVKYDTVIQTNLKTYYIYNCGSFIHISDKEYETRQAVKDEPRSATEFFKKWNAPRLVEEYPINTALTLLCTFYGAPRSSIIRYFGGDWYKNRDAEFKPPEDRRRRTVLKIEDIIQLTLSDIMQLPEYNELASLYELIKQMPTTYSNYKLYMLMGEIINILMFT